MFFIAYMRRCSCVYRDFPAGCDIVFHTTTLKVGSFSNSFSTGKALTKREKFNHLRQLARLLLRHCAMFSSITKTSRLVGLLTFSSVFVRSKDPCMKKQTKRKNWSLLSNKPKARLQPATKVTIIL